MSPTAVLVARALLVGAWAGRRQTVHSASGPAVRAAPTCTPAVREVTSYCFCPARLRELLLNPLCPALVRRICTTYLILRCHPLCFTQRLCWKMPAHGSTKVVGLTGRSTSGVRVPKVHQVHWLLQLLVESHRSAFSCTSWDVRSLMLTNWAMKGMVDCVAGDCAGAHAGKPWQLPAGQ